MLRTAGEFLAYWVGLSICLTLISLFAWDAVFLHQAVGLGFLAAVGFLLVDRWGATKTTAQDERRPRPNTARAAGMVAFGAYIVGYWVYGVWYAWGHWSGFSGFDILYAFMRAIIWPAWVVLALMLLIGAVIGAQFGARAGAKLHGEELRGLRQAVLRLAGDPRRRLFDRCGPLRPAAAFLGVVAACLLTPAGAAKANPLVADLSRHLVAISTGFAGADVLLFGATEGEGDVVVIVRGPDRPVVVHRKSRVLGVWANTAQMTFDRVPSFYAIASSRPLADIAPSTVLAREEMGLENLRLELSRSKASANVAAEWRDGLIRNHQRDGLYQTKVERVIFLGNRLFRAKFELPANVPTGEYKVKVVLLLDGRVVSAQTTPLQVGKVGAEAAIYDFAHQNPAFYGIIAILVALMAGWVAHLAFRKA